uniref:Large ribosomal subunit protein bL20c n=1 Tax=Codium arenicola TaxID=1191365 RepID=A0A2P0QI09_9CHLO|nr:ribosomal protein L20 [Codium arenicola]ARO74386.1 ribosomal protein L20 [Codium arenicola]
MIRVKRGKNAKNRRKKILKQTRGFKGSGHRLYSSGRQKLLKSKILNYNHRKVRKRVNRQLWIIRLNAFLRIYNSNYSQFIRQIKLNQMQLNRKILSQLILYDRQNIFKLLKNYD